jgi:hypothetical protein
MNYTEDPGAVARRYIEAVGARDFEAVAQLLHDDFSFTSGGRSTSSADAYLDALRKLAPIIARNEIRRVFTSGQEVCVVYDFVTDTPVGPVLSVELLTVDADRVRSSELLFEKARWPEVIEVLAARQAVL